MAGLSELCGRERMEVASEDCGSCCVTSLVIALLAIDVMAMM